MLGKTSTIGLVLALCKPMSMTLPSTMRDGTRPAAGDSAVPSKPPVSWAIALFVLATITLGAVSDFASTKGVELGTCGKPSTIEAVYRTLLLH
jgi:hypothetical protein